MMTYLTTIPRVALSTRRSELPRSALSPIRFERKTSRRLPSNYSIWTLSAIQSCRLEFSSPSTLPPSVSLWHPFRQTESAATLIWTNSSQLSMQNFSQACNLVPKYKFPLSRDSHDNIHFPTNSGFYTRLELKILSILRCFKEGFGGVVIDAKEKVSNVVVDAFVEQGSKHGNQRTSKCGRVGAATAPLRHISGRKCRSSRSGGVPVCWAEVEKFNFNAQRSFQEMTEKSFKLTKDASCL
ncbi:hypothetical protein Tco_0462806 [Tanacetum coccineum]